MEICADIFSDVFTAANTEYTLMQADDSELQETIYDDKGLVMK